MESDRVVVCAGSTCVHGSIRLVMSGVLAGLLSLGAAWLQMMVELKYQDRAVNEMGVVLGAAEMRTSNSWYPWRS